MQNKKGVSLIVLSITILVMAILAATAIIALEDSGIIGRSKNTSIHLAKGGAGILDESFNSRDHTITLSLSKQARSGA